MTKSNYIDSFKIPIGKDYYNVIICKTKKEMYKYRKELSKDKSYGSIKNFNFEAICSSKIIEPRKFGEVGTLVFWEKSSKHIGVVAHELTHACLYWWIARVNADFAKNVKIKSGKQKRCFLKIKNAQDELFANLVGECVNSYWKIMLKKSSEIYTGK